jgi:hypothetical protein
MILQLSDHSTLLKTPDGSLLLLQLSAHDQSSGHTIPKPALSLLKILGTENGLNVSFPFGAVMHIDSSYKQ